MRLPQLRLGEKSHRGCPVLGAAKETRGSRGYRSCVIRPNLKLREISCFTRLGFIL